MYIALELSKHIVSKCIEDSVPISNLQLQKILFYIQRDFLKRGKLAFTDSIEAWQFGPVVPNVYYHYCGYGAMPITILETKEEDYLSKEDLLCINNIVEEKRILNPWDMVSETHTPGGAWDLIYRNGVGNRQVIPIELIKAENRRCNN